MLFPQLQSHPSPEEASSQTYPVLASAQALTPYKDPAAPEVSAESDVPFQQGEVRGVEVAIHVNTTVGSQRALDQIASVISFFDDSPLPGYRLEFAMVAESSEVTLLFSPESEDAQSLQFSISAEQFVAGEQLVEAQKIYSEVTGEAVVAQDPPPPSPAMPRGPQERVPATETAPPPLPQPEIHSDTAPSRLESKMERLVNIGGISPEIAASILEMAETGAYGTGEPLWEQTVAVALQLINTDWATVDTVAATFASLANSHSPSSFMELARTNQIRSV